MNNLVDVLWPGDVFFRNLPIPNRSDQDKLDTRLEAKKLFVHGRLLPTESLVHIVGQYNTINGLSRIFNMLQNQSLNRVLVSMLLDSIVRTIFSNSWLKILYSLPIFFIFSSQCNCVFEVLSLNPTLFVTMSSEFGKLIPEPF